MHFPEGDASRNLEDLGNANAEYGTLSFFPVVSICSEASFMTAVCCDCDIVVSTLGASGAYGVALEPAVYRISNTVLGVSIYPTRCEDEHTTCSGIVIVAARASFTAVGIPREGRAISRIEARATPGKLLASR